MEELLRCPFCGGEAEIEQHTFMGYSHTYGVTCLNCRGQTRQFYATEQEAIDAWNRRTQNIGKKECCEQGEEQ